MTSKPVQAASVPPRTRPSNYPEPFASRVTGRQKQALGDFFGLTNFGVNRTTLKPGSMSALRHWHTRQDEFVYVLSGRPTLVTNAGEMQLAPGMCVGFKAGQRDGHHLVNRTADEVIYLEVGDRMPGDAVSYPDDDLQAVMGADGKWQFLHKDGSPY
ncbi:MAG TPA: cupin domain-containing protein [Burkholderiaceae bacterium]|nr:cupin domain-containing protein [Burkholderiaceae bacterium]